MSSKLAIHDFGPSRGRGYVCTAPIVAGEELLVSEAYAIGIHELWTRETCHGCLQFADRKFHKVRCKGCMAVSYCSEQCRDRSHRRHVEGATECTWFKLLGKVLTRAEYSHFSPDFKTLLKMIISIICRRHDELNGNQNLHYEFLPEGDKILSLPRLEFKDVLNLVTNREVLSQDLATRNSWDEIIEVIEAVLPKEMHVPRDLLIDLACMDECNSIGFWDGSRDMYAFALAPTGSYFNHSCDPNVKKYTEGRQIVFRALKDVQVGEELTICYAWVDDEVVTRRKTLLEGFYFECSCDRCQRELKELGEKGKLVEVEAVQVMQRLGEATLGQSEPVENPFSEGNFDL